MRRGKPIYLSPYRRDGQKDTGTDPVPPLRAPLAMCGKHRNYAHQLSPFVGFYLIDETDFSSVGLWNTLAVRATLCL